MKTETFEETLKPYVEKILQGLEKGVDYTVHEIPIVLQQFVIFEAVRAWLNVLFGIILLFLFVKYIKKEWKKGNNSFLVDKSYIRPDKTPLIVITLIFGAVVTILSSVAIFDNIFIAIQASFFPKLFLVEKFIEIF